MEPKRGPVYQSENALSLERQIRAARKFQERAARELQKMAIRELEKRVARKLQKRAARNLLMRRNVGTKFSDIAQRLEAQKTHSFCPPGNNLRLRKRPLTTKSLKALKYLRGE